MKETSPKISIITVTYNSAKSLSKTIESVLGQSLLPYEYIIVDGLSTDETVSIAGRYADAFSQKGISYKIVSEADEGMYDAMNKGIRLASGDIIGIINSDDYYEPSALAVVAKAFLESDFELFYADLRMHRRNGKSFIKHARNRSYATGRDWNHPTTFIRSDIYQKFAYRNESIHDDYDLILRLKKNHVKVCVVNEVLANYSMNGISHERSLKKAVSRMKIKYRIYRNNGYSPFYFFECFIVEIGKLLIG